MDNENIKTMTAKFFYFDMYCNKLKVKDLKHNFFICEMTKE